MSCFSLMQKEEPGHKWCRILSYTCHLILFTCIQTHILAPDWAIQTRTAQTGGSIQARTPEWEIWVKEHFNQN